MEIGWISNNFKNLLIQLQKIIKVFQQPLIKGGNRERRGRRWKEYTYNHESPQGELPKVISKKNKECDSLKWTG